MYGGTKSELERLLKDASSMPGVLSDATSLSIDSFSDIIEAISRVQQQMEITGTTGKEALSTIEGSTNQAKAAWENLLTAIGTGDDQQIAEAMQAMMDSIPPVIENALPRIGTIFGKLAENIPNIAQSVADTLAPMLLEGVQTAYDNLKGGLAGIGIDLPDFKDLVDSIKQLADKAVAAAPSLSMLAVSVLAVVSAFNAMKTVQTVANVVSSGLNLMTTSFAGISAGTTTFSALATAATGLSVPLLAIVGVIAAVAAGFALFMAYNDIPFTFEGIGQALQQVADIISGAFTAAVETLAPIAQNLIGALQPLADTILPAIQPAIQTVGDAFSNLASAVLPLLANAFNIVVNVINVALPIIQMIATVVGSVISVVITVVSSVLSVVVNVIATIISFIGMVLGVVATITGIVSGVLSTVLGVVTGVVSTIVAAVTGFINLVVSGITGMVNTVLSFLTNLFSGIASIFAMISSAIASAVSGIVSKVTGGFNGLVSAVSGALGNVVSVVSSLPSRAMSALGNIGSTLYNSGKSLIDGFINGIKAAAEGIGNAVSGVLSKVRSFFPFSPAKRGPFSGHGYTTYSGKALINDFAESITKATPAAMSAVNSAVASVRGAFDGITVNPTVQAAPWQAQLDTAPVYQTVNFNQPVQTPDQLSRTMRMQARYGLAGAYS